MATTAPPQYHSLPRYHELRYLMQWRDEGLIHKLIPVDNSIIMKKIHNKGLWEGVFLCGNQPVCRVHPIGASDDATNAVKF